MTEPIETLHFKADFGRDLTYGHARADITGYVLRAEWTLGFETPYQVMAGPNQLTLVLDNQAGDWNVLKTGATFAGLMQRDVLIRIEYTYAAQTWYLAVFKVVDVEIVPGRFGARTITVTCQNWHADLMGTIYDPPLTANTTTGTAVLEAFTNGAAPFYPTASAWWIVGAGALGTDTILPEYTTAGYLQAHAGSTTLDYVGDNIDRGGGVSLYAFIEEMCLAELGGRFRYQINTALGVPYYAFYGRTTLAQFYNRTNTYVATLADFDAAEYGYGQDQTNAIEITCYPRRAGSAGTVIASTTSPIAIDGLGSRQIALRYRDPGSPDATCAATVIIQPVASTDYTGNLAADGTGENYTGNLVVSVENLTNAAKVTINNTATGRVYLTMLQIRGTPLTALQPVTLRAVDAESIASYGLIKQAITVAGLDNEELIQQYAEYYVRTHSQPGGAFRSVSFLFTGNTPAGLAEYVYEPLSDTEPLLIQDDWIEDAADAKPYWVAGLRCAVDAQAQTWAVTFVLEDYSFSAGFWKLEDDELGVLDQTTRLAF